MTQLCRLFNWCSAGVLRTSNSLCRKDRVSLDNNVFLWMYTVSSYWLPVLSVDCGQVISVYLTTSLKKSKRIITVLLTIKINSKLSQGVLRDPWGD